MDHRVRQSTRRRLSTIGLVLAVLALVVAVAPEAEAGKKKRGGKGKNAAARSFLPPKGKLYAGVSDTGQTSDYKEYRKKAGAHPPVMQSFESWGYIPEEALRRWEMTHTRGMLSLSTGRCWGCKPLISTGEIAGGAGDRYITALARALADRKEPTYIRLFPEMNGHWNGYSAFHGNGQPKDPKHSTQNFRKAWKRFVLITRGGPRKAIDKKLRRLGMPKVKGTKQKKLARPKVAFAWVPQSEGSPDVRGNQPANYWPGYAYVDWVGADIYSRFPNFAGLNQIYSKYRKRPFMVGEWSPWGSDDAAFVRDLFDWVEKRGRAKMAVYYQGFGEGSDNEFELTDYPAATRVLRQRLNGKRWELYTPENAKDRKRAKQGKKGNKRGKR